MISGESARRPTIVMRASWERGVLEKVRRVRVRRWEEEKVGRREVRKDIL